MNHVSGSDPLPHERLGCTPGLRKGPTSSSSREVGEPQAAGITAAMPSPRRVADLHEPDLRLIECIIESIDVTATRSAPSCRGPRVVNVLDRFSPVETEGRGRIILLNGASSSGKSSIGRALQRIQADPWFLFPVDSLGEMRSPGHTRVLDEDEIDAMLRRTRMGYHRAVAAVASVGNDVIMDYPLSEPWRVNDLLDVLEGYDVTVVDVRCAPDELDRRERARADRPVGLARSQRVFRHDDRDIAVDTTDTSPEACALAIATELAALNTDKAFDRLRRLRS